jgi:eukaryotic-like serine/threonine-protein kinase
LTTADQGRLGGRYELVHRIARGGGGTVWRARDTALDRTVAVKEIRVPDELADDERHRARQRVLHEARAAARLDHPGAVVVHDVLDGGDRLHLVMELVEAPTLRERVERDGPLPEGEAAAIGLELVDVIGAAHERGIVHRDIKPSNIFVLDSGAVKLADFGIAALSGESSLTRTGTALGSPSYLAPEQAQGDDAAPPADLWGLGASLYYAIEGEPPFERGNAVATVHAVVHDDPRPFRLASRTVPLLQRLLDKQADARPTLAATRHQLTELTGTSTAPATTERLTPLPPPMAAAPEPDPAPDAVRAGRRRPLALVGGLAIIAVLGLAALVMATGPDDVDDDVTAEAPDAERDEAEGTDPPGDGDATGPAEEDAAVDDPDAPTAAPEDDATGPTDDDQATGPAEIPESEVPEGWQVVEGETYRVAIPPGWQERSAAGNLTDYVDPDTGAYLRVDWTDDPAADPVADWEANERGFAERQDDYERIRLEPAVYRGEDAALWEYTYRDGGADLHALNLNVLAGERAYALNLQAPADAWDDVGGLFPSVAGGFEPDG